MLYVYDLRVVVLPVCCPNGDIVLHKKKNITTTAQGTDET